MLDQATQQRISTILPRLDEHLARLYLAAEAESLGRGGISAISEFTGVNRNIVFAP